MNDKLKAHWDEYKKLYIGIAIGAGVTYVVMQNKTQIINLVAPQINPVFNNTNAVINYSGHCTKIVKCIETGEMWETVTDAAKAMDVPLHTMSRHLNGATDHVFGKHFEVIGLGTTG